jgi:hypothetical protein
VRARTKLEPFSRESVLCKTISVWHGLIIQGLPKNYQKYRLVDLVVDFNLSVKETRRVVNLVKAGRLFVDCARVFPGVDYKLLEDGLCSIVMKNDRRLRYL